MNKNRGLLFILLTESAIGSHLSDKNTVRGSITSCYLNRKGCQTELEIKVRAYKADYMLIGIIINYKCSTFLVNFLKSNRHSILFPNFY